MRHLAAVLLVGMVFTVGWQESRWGPVEIQYATTPTSTWKRLGIAPAGGMSYDSPADNNTVTRGRAYWFRERTLFDNGAVTPWSKPHVAIWLTGNIPGAVQVIGKDNVFVTLKGGK